MITREEILHTAMRQSAADCSCAPEDFRKAAPVVVESRASQDASRYMKLPHICMLVSYGSNVVVSCRRSLVPEMTVWADRAAENPYHSFVPPLLDDLNRILKKADAQAAWMSSYFLPEPDLIFGGENSGPSER